MPEPMPDRRPPQSRKPKGAPVFVLVAGAMLLLLLMVAVASFGFSQRSEELTGSELMAKLEQRAVASLELHAASDSGDFKVTGKYLAAPEGSPKEFRSRLSRQEWQQLLEQRAKNPETSLLQGVKYNTEVVDDTIGRFIWSALPILIVFVIIWFVFFRRGGGPMGGGVINFGRSRAKMFTKEDVSVTFGDVAGADEAKEEVSEIVEFLKNPGRFARLGAHIPRGVLLVGPPGCGKTLLAKAIAGEAERPFFSISGSDFVEMFVGVGASRVRDLFRNARENAPCIVFIDEIDAVGRRRGTGVGGGHDEREQTLNAILVEMDGIGSAEGVIVLAATNRPDVLDQALLRPGRFDRQVVIDLPDVKGREEIFRVHLKKVKVAHDIDAEELARLTPGFSGADIMNIVNEAALVAVIRNLDAVDRDSILEARDRVRFGRAKRSRVMEEEERKKTAVHEAGHTLVAQLTPTSDKVHKVTIIPRGRALGATMSLPDKDRYSLGVQRAEERLMVLYGGRAAEQVVYGTVDAGAASDIQQATEIARRMVAEWGMSPRVGQLNYMGEEDQSYLGSQVVRPAQMSNETALLIDQEMKRITDEAYQKTLTMVSENREKLEAIWHALLKYETLERTDVEWILAGKDIAEKRRRDDEERKAALAARKLRAMEEASRPRPETQPFLPPAGQAGTA